MTRLGGPAAIAALLSFNAGFVDTVGFLGLQGLFTAHVTGNFVTLGAALVLGHQGIVNKILALPEFIVAVALARLAGTAMSGRDWPVLRIFLVVEVVLLAGFCALAVAYGPFPDADTPVALVTGGVAVAAMAVQNAVQRVHLAALPPTTIMTGNTTQVTIEAVDLLTGVAGGEAARTRFARLAGGIIIFAAGCAAAALMFYLYGFWSLLLPVTGGIAAVAISQFKSI